MAVQNTIYRVKFKIDGEIRDDIGELLETTKTWHAWDELNENKRNIIMPLTTLYYILVLICFAYP
jgi:hypothetical protein